MYQPPFVAGWTYGRRQGHFLAIGTPEAVFRCVLPAHSAHPSEADCTHQLVTAVIDWVPTALAFGTDGTLLCSMGDTGGYTFL